jgi:two-component system sensor histidine kinase DegS
MAIKTETERSSSGYQPLGGKVTNIDSKMLDKIVRHTVAAVDKSRSQIYEIYEASRRELDNVRKDLERVKLASAAIINTVDELERLERRGRIHLMEVSRDPQRYGGETAMHAAYTEASRLQVELAVAREKEINFRQQRDQLEVRLRSLSDTVEKAENLVAQVGAVMGYLGNQMNNVVCRMESLEERQLFGAKIIKAQEEERRRVARDIHDGPAQYMANVVFRAEVCERLLDQDLERVRAELQELRSQVRLCLQETRKIIFDLRPMTIDDLGLAPTLRRMLDTLKERYGILTELRIIGEERRFPSVQEVGAFRLIQEALTNAEKHAEAGKIVVRLEFRSDFVSAVVEDDGIGFDLQASRSGNSFGLIGMRERAELLGGEALVNSQPGHGTKVFIKVPIRPGS